MTFHFNAIVSCHWCKCRQWSRCSPSYGQFKHETCCNYEGTRSEAHFCWRELTWRSNLLEEGKETKKYIGKAPLSHFSPLLYIFMIFGHISLESDGRCCIIEVCWFIDHNGKKNVGERNFFSSVYYMIRNAKTAFVLSRVLGFALTMSCSNLIC